MNYRFAVKTDITALAQIEQLQPRCAQWGAPGWTGELAEKSARIFCAEENGRVCGFVALRAAADVGEILNVGVHPDVLRRGIAETLLEQALAWARQNGVKQLTLEVAASNSPAVRLYQKAGFVQTGLRKNFYAGREDALILGRAL